MVSLDKMGVPKNFDCIKVVGCGSCGFMQMDFIYQKLEEADYVVMDTESESLEKNMGKCKDKFSRAGSMSGVLIGEALLHGQGVRYDADLAEKVAIESRQQIIEALQGAQVVFVIAGMGGATGSGMANVVADIAKEIGAYTVGIGFMPFSFEGSKRVQNAINGLEKLKKNADGIVVIELMELLEKYGSDTPVEEAFKMKFDDYEEKFREALKNI